MLSQKTGYDLTSMSLEMPINSVNLDELQQKSLSEGYKCVVGGLVLREFENGQRAIYAQKRAANRPLFPNCWDILGGHVDEGESLIEALSREIKEESGWQLKNIIKHLKTVRWQNNSGESIQEFVFLITVTGDLDKPEIETEKFSEYRWVLQKDINVLKENRQEGEQLIFELARLAFADHSSEANPESNPWTTLSSKLIYNNPWLSFREDKVLNPAGGEGIYGVASPKTVGASAIPIDEDGNIYLVRQFRYSLGKFTWEICSGGAALSEDTLEAAKRELLEETGIQASTWTELAQIDVSNSVTDAIGTIYLAEGLSFGKANTDVVEDITVKKVALDEALAMLERNEISDVTSMVGLLKLAIQKAKTIPTSNTTSKSQNTTESSNSPWQQLSRKTIYQNPWVTLYEDEVITPKKTKGIYSVVEFKNKAGAVIPIDRQGYTWLVGQYRYPLDRYSWELPMGGVEEAVLLGTKRELREETGIEANKWSKILQFDTIQSFGKEDATVFVAQDLSFGDYEPEETEALQVRKVHIDDAIAMALKGELSDSLTLAGLFKFALVKAEFDL